MDSKPRITNLFTILTVSALLLLSMPFTDSAFSATGEENLFVIHVSSFKNQKSAETEISRFLEQDLQAFYKNEIVEGKGSWYRVFIGTFKTRQEAQAKGIELMAAGIISYAAPREVKPDFIPGRKTAEVEIAEEKPVSPPAAEKESPPVQVPQKQVAQPEETVPPPVIEKESPPVEVPQKQVAKPAEKTVQETPIPEKKIAMDREEKAESKPEKESSQDKFNFSLALNGGAFISSSAEDFSITEATPSVIRTFYFNGDAYQISIEPSVRAYKDFNIYGRVEYVFIDEVDIFFISLGPKLRFDLTDSVFPYIKGGAVWGKFNFDAAPGEFDDGFGYEGGFGLEILKTPYKVGFDLLYRSIEFDYISPDIAGVTASDSSIDASGLSMSGTFTIFF